MSGECLTSIPSRGRQSCPRPPIWVTANMRSNRNRSSAVYVSFLTWASPYAGGRTSGVVFAVLVVPRVVTCQDPDAIDRLLVRGVHRRERNEAPTFRIPVRPAAFGGRCWHDRVVDGGVTQRAVDAEPREVIVRATVAAGPDRVHLDARLSRRALEIDLAEDPWGSTSASTLSPTLSAVVGSTFFSTTSCRRSVSARLARHRRYQSGRSSGPRRRVRVTFWSLTAAPAVNTTRPTLLRCVCARSRVVPPPTE